MGPTRVANIAQESGRISIHYLITCVRGPELKFMSSSLKGFRSSHISHPPRSK